jgi:hypothetical protein
MLGVTLQGAIEVKVCKATRQRPAPFEESMLPEVLEAGALLGASDTASDVELQPSELVEHQGASAVQAHGLVAGHVLGLRYLDRAQLARRKIEDLHVLGDGFVQREAIDVASGARPDGWYVGIGSGV